MVTKEKRRRRLAHAKWERQQDRRAKRARNVRRRGIVIGVVVCLVLAVLAGLGIMQLVK